MAASQLYESLVYTLSQKGGKTVHFFFNIFRLTIKRIATKMAL